MAKIYLSVVIPAYNEEHNLRSGVMGAVYDYLKNQDYSWEVLIANDGSTDLTSELVRKALPKHFGFRLLDEPHRGKGGTIIAGMLVARGENILFTDMDQATPLDQLEKLLPKIDEGYDIAIGSRTGREGAPLVRQLMAAGYSLLRAVVLQLPYKDTQCGFKLFKKGAAKKIFERMKIFNDKKLTEGAAVTAGFDLEILYVAPRILNEPIG